MELRQLEYFVAVAEEANFTRAAERVHISQSGVSAQVRQLETDLGATLIDRSSRAATLTAAGRAALPHARVALAAVADVRRAVDEVTGVVRGRLTIGMVNGCTIRPLFDALAMFRDDHAAVELALFEGDTGALVEAVRQGAADIALVGIVDAPPAGFEAIAFAPERLVAAVAPDHPLGRRRRTTLAAMSAFPLVCMPVGTAVRAMFDAACAAAGVHPDVALQASAPDAVGHLAARGLGVAVLTESMVAHLGGILHAVHIDDVRATAGLALIWRSGDNPALREMVAACRIAFAGLEARAAG